MGHHIPTMALTSLRWHPQTATDADRTLVRRETWSKAWGQLWG